MFIATGVRVLGGKVKDKKMTKPKKKLVTKKPVAKAKSKPAPKKVVKPVAKAKVAPKPAPVAKPQAKVARKPVKAAAKPAELMKPVAPAAQRPATPAAPLRTPPAQTFIPASRPVMSGPVVATPSAKKLSFKIGELVVYPAHGVGRITNIEEQEIAGARLELYIVDFEKEKLRLKVPTGRAEQKGMRRLADKALIEQALRVLKGRARIKRTMWSRRAQEYDAKINSGDLIAVAEVVRDLYRSERQPEQSYSERQLFEQALERMAREIAAVKKIDDDQGIKELEDYLVRNARRTPVPGEKTEEEVPAEEAA